jgi:hypothetical protein
MGWLTHINDSKRTNPKDLFGMELSYESGFDHTNFNGNISGVKWQSYSDYAQRAYGYRYDNLNRITQADFRAWNVAWMDWSGRQESGKGNSIKWQNFYNFHKQ